MCHLYPYNNVKLLQKFFFTLMFILEAGSHASTVHSAVVVLLYADLIRSVSLETDAGYLPSPMDPSIYSTVTQAECRLTHRVVCGCLHDVSDSASFSPHSPLRPLSATLKTRCTVMLAVGGRRVKLCPLMMLS